MAGIVILVLSLIITVKVCKKINQNTIGTTQAYLKRGFTVYIIVFFILIAIANKMGLVQ